MFIAAPMRAATDAALRESPPRAKKSSSAPTRSRPSTSANAAATAASDHVDGARYSRAAKAGSGSASRSSLPLAVSGTSSSTTTAAGTM
ncbi:Uncharacterised protein [Mycobacteroides abscessus subsp. abscessus]|nr:Uncharacterised protein [Mycobacteroides abscessus subsp. abscessus]